MCEHPMLAGGLDANDSGCIGQAEVPKEGLVVRELVDLTQDGDDSFPRRGRDRSRVWDTGRE